MSRLKLPSADKGNVIVRFAPEPSGYLHIGHLKAIFLNKCLVDDLNAKLILRFDDTNPSKEKKSYKDEILIDLKKIGITPDQITHTSDYFDIILKHCRKLIESGKAYMDNTPSDKMKEDRNNGIKSLNRDNTIIQNIELFDEFIISNNSNYCVRAKIDYKNKNKCLRDPVIYRSNSDEHMITGNNYKCYPTYDFACPIVDSIEKITYALRSREYNDHKDIYKWMKKNMDLKNIHLYHFSKVNFVNTVLSKRKLKWLVDQKIVEGWDDPRLPTIRGILGRGMTKTALIKYIRDLGNSNNCVHIEWDKIWAYNKKIIDKIVPRLSCVQDDYKILQLDNITSNEIVEVDLHPKNCYLGEKNIYRNSKLIINTYDADCISVGEEISLLHYGNVLITSIKDDMINGDFIENGDFKKTKMKINWLPYDDTLLKKVSLISYDHIISKKHLQPEDDFKCFVNYDSKIINTGYCSLNINQLNKEDIVQFERMGYYKYKDDLTFIEIPTGRKKKMIN